MKRETKEREDAAGSESSKRQDNTGSRLVYDKTRRCPLAGETVEGPYHPRIERSRNGYFAKKKEEEHKMLEKKAAKYFENEWVTEIDVKGHERPACAGTQFQETASPDKFSRFKEGNNNTLLQAESAVTF